MKRILRKNLVVFLIIALPISFAQAQTSPETEGPADPAELEAFIDGIMAAHLAANHIAGATFATVKDGQLFHAKGYGFADVEKKKPVLADKTLFRPGSVSKLFVWTAVMQLYEQGKLDLNADVNIYLDEFKIPATFPEPITLTHLMTHTPGFEDVYIGMGARQPEDLVPEGKWLADNIPARVFPPGEITAYSNYGTALAAFIAEKIAGISFEEYLEEYIFKPLDMHQSTFRQPLPPELADNMSEGYTYKNGVFKTEEFELLNGIAPAGSMSTTATDISKFMIAHLQKGKYKEVKILEEETAELMQTRLFSHDPRLNGNAHGFWERNLNNLRILEHGGDTVFFHTFFVMIPEKNVGFFVSYNSAGAGLDVREELLQAFLDRYYPTLEQTVPEPSPDSKERLSRIAGCYGTTRGVYTTLEKMVNLFTVVKVKATDEGRLLIKMPAGLGNTQWIEVEPFIFREVGTQNVLIFKQDSNGRIAHAFLSNVPYFAFVKLKWYETPVFHYCFLGFSIIFFVSVFAWSIGALRRKLCMHRIEEKKAPRWSRWVAGGMSVLNLLFLFGLAGIMSDPFEIIFGVPSTLKAVLVLPLISIVFTLATLIFAILAWKKRCWNLCGRVHYTLILAAGLIFIWLLNYWNLLGFRF